MLRVVEAFSGIGSQAKALHNINAEHEIVATVEWDLNAIYAYDIIHNGPQDLSEYEHFTKQELIETLLQHTLSNDGKRPLTEQTLKVMSADALQRFLCAIHRTNNLVSITDVTADVMPEDVDVLTYSFPCQDLSICGSWHGNMTGIDRNANNRSGMLWEIERILGEYVEQEMPLPRFLLMENVSNILSATHRHNFDEWKDYLEELGYINQVYTLNAATFGIPQRRIRTYMLSVLVNDENEIEFVQQYLQEHNLEDQVALPLPALEDFLRMNYVDETYLAEADMSNPNNTPSRQRIFHDNDMIFENGQMVLDRVKTITTKQDRNPNSGLIAYQSRFEGKAPYRNLTPRECFLLMGFEETDFQALMDNDFDLKRNHHFFTREKLIKLAGNSIVVNVLESIFAQVVDLQNFFELA